MNEIITDIKQLINRKLKELILNKTRRRFASVKRIKTEIELTPITASEKYIAYIRHFILNKNHNI